MDVPFLGLSVSRTNPKRMADSVNETFTKLEKMGLSLAIEQQSSYRHDELVELDEFIKSPVTSVPDKVDAIDSVIFRNLQWGGGAVNAAWDRWYSAWLVGYHNVWLPILSSATPAVTWRFDVEFKRRGLNMAGKQVVQTRRGRFDAETVLYMQLSTDRYPSVGVPVPVRVVNESPGRIGRTVDAEMTEREVMDFGRQYPLKWGKGALSLLQHPQYVMPSAVYMYSGAQAPQPGRTTPPPAADFQGTRTAPGSPPIPAMVQGGGG